ncbi:MAG: glucosaminidase domain-containing protein, partial [Syntrophorhabdaceae bacterium]|nr:glucosaminidase domain-containing protein [Syntrophorhabdaceae bacterium]
MGTTLDQRVKFIHTIYNDALMASASTGIPVKAILAQAALETGWGTELLAGTNNLFNIKADSSWEGSSATFNVLEFEKGERVYRNEDFRVYSSYEESFEDWVDFLQANPRYADCFSEESLSNDANFVNALAEAGYATDPHYAAKLMSTINGQSMRRALASLFQSVPNYEPAPSFVDINDLYGLPDMLAPWIDLFDSATRTISPLVLDLDGDGVETMGLKDGAYFDHDGNGFSEQTGWAGCDDGLLVLDRDGDRIIENGTEVFGNQTVLQNGRKAANGFQALSEWDGNADGRIDNNDSVWNQLKVWRDTDGDGYSSADELYTLEELGIQSISTVATGSTCVDDSGNEHRQVGTYTKTDGTVLAVTDVWFQTETAYTIADEWLDVPEDILNLPDLKGYGNTYDLHQAMVRDSSGQLRSLLEEFVQTTDITARNKLMDQILFKWTGSEDIVSNSKGNCIDARKLAVLETLFGRVYTGGLGPNAVSLLEQSYFGVKEMCYAQLMAQAHLKDVCDMIIYSWDEASQSIKG